MKPELQWPLYFSDHERFCKCPLKDDVQLSLVLGAITAAVLALVLAI